MSDQKKWFKVWTTILTDPSHSNMSLEDVGRWTRLGAYLASVGDSGEITIRPPAKAFLLAMELPTLETAKEAIKRLPNVYVDDQKYDNGEFIVIMKNWSKYQVDSTVYDRVKRLRCKKRGEEKRKDVKDFNVNTYVKGLDSPTPRPKGASASPLRKNGHDSNCTCEQCWQKTMRIN